MKIMIVGTPNSLQEELKKHVEDIIHEEQLECLLDIVDDRKEVMEVGSRQIILTPALVVDDKILSQGHIWTKEHIRHFLLTNCADRRDSSE